MTKQTWIRFETMKNGQRAAYKSPSLTAGWLRISADLAHHMLVMGSAIQVYPVTRLDGRIVYVTVPND
jgi:hypothetical protein